MPPTSTSQAVPFVDLGPSSARLNQRILGEFAELLESSRFHYGPQLTEFEKAFAEYCTVQHCVGMSSGLDALRLALLATGLEPGDEVLAPANTFIATFAAIRQAGGVPVPVDVSETDYNIDPELVGEAVTGRTRFLVPVHLYGQLADMRALVEITPARRLTVVEDACQAHGAERDGFRAGAAGSASAFSFYPSKNLGAAGDAGAAVTDDGDVDGLLRALRHHGETVRHHSAREGYTARMDTIQAIVLLHKLRLLDEWNDERRAAAAYYTDALEGVGDLVLPSVADNSAPVWHLYVVRTARPTELADHLASRGIGTGRHYPEPPHVSNAFAWLGYERGAFPVTEAIAAEVLSLPLFPGIREAQLETVCAAVADYFG